MWLDDNMKASLKLDIFRAIIGSRGDLSPGQAADRTNFVYNTLYPAAESGGKPRAKKR